jgi:hypothetical protein
MEDAAPTRHLSADSCYTSSYGRVASSDRLHAAQGRVDLSVSKDGSWRDPALPLPLGRYHRSIPASLAGIATCR